MLNASIFYNETLMVWVVLAHIAFLVTPLLFAASDEWLHQNRFEFKSLKRAHYSRYPHYLAH